MVYKMEKIYEAISNVMAEVGAIGKGSYNQMQKFKYRGIDDVMNALQPILVKHKVFVTPTVLEQIREERASKNGGNLIYSVCKIEYKFFTTDGSYITCVVVGEGMDSGDKATNKAMAIAFKYACFQVFCIPTEEMKDPDAECHEVTSKQSNNKTSNTVNNLTDKQVKRLFVIAKTAGRTDKQAREEIAKRYGKNAEELSKSEYDQICVGYEKVAEKLGGANEQGN